MLPARLTVLFRARELELQIKSRSRHGLLVKKARVQGMKPVIGGRTIVSVGARSIIAILIG